MKTILASFVLYFAFASLQAQTNIPLLNGNLSTGTTLAPDSLSWKSIAGFTFAQDTTAVLKADSSGVVNGELCVKGKNGFQHADFKISTDPVDISTLSTSSTLIYSFNMMAQVAASGTAPYLVTVILRDSNGVDVTANTIAVPITKVQGSYKTSINTYQQNACTVVLKPNASGGNAKTASLVVSVGLMLSSNLKFDDFKLQSFAGSPTVTVSTPANLALSYVQGAGPSTESSFTVEGANLSDSIVVTTGSNLEISLTSGTGFGFTPIRIAPSSGAVTPITIYARLKAGLNSTATLSNTSLKATISSKTLGVASKTVQFTGKVNTIAGIETLEDGIRLLASNGKIALNGLKVGERIEIYDIMGKVIVSRIADSEFFSITVNKGIYMVRVNSFAQKVFLN